MKGWRAPLLLALVAAGCSRGGASAVATQPPAAVAANPASVDDGARVYLVHCASCHQPDGRGIADAVPALAGNPAVTGDPQRPIAAVRDGGSGTIRTAGIAYRVEMPAWGGVLSDEQIAEVVGYIRSAWGNRASDVSAADVSRRGAAPPRVR